MRKKKADELPMCLHCQKIKANRPRGLCWKCYYDPVIQQQYPINSKYAELCLREPTEEELEHTIAEQLPTMPSASAEEMPPRQPPQILFRQLLARRWR